MATTPAREDFEVAAGTAGRGRYEVLAQFASGGMASVHFGRIVSAGGFSRIVAIKRLHPEFAKDPEVVSMLLHEARLTGLLDHPNIVPTLDVVVAPGDVFIVMGYVNGAAFATIRRAVQVDGKRMPPSIAASILASVLRGLHAAHDAKDAAMRPLNIVHQDVSPQNILVGIDGVARITDFGIALSESRDRPSAGSAESGYIRGTLPYLAPERVAGQRATPRSDIYSAGVVLWEALAGKRLFSGEPEQVLAAIAIDTPPPPSRFAPDVPPELEDIVLRALERDPARRFSTAKEMADAIESSMKIAHPAEVSAWLEPLVGESLRTRAELLDTTQELPVLRTLTVDAEGTSTWKVEGAKEPPTPSARTDTPEPPPPRVGRTRGMALMAGAAILIVGVWLAFVLSRGAAPTPAPTAAVSEAAPDVPPLVPARTAEPAPSPSPPPAKPQAVPRRTSAPPPAAGRARADCRQKYTVDSAGRTIFRDECF